MWDAITYPFPNFNSYTVEVWEWISNFIPHFCNGCDYLSMLGDLMKPGSPSKVNCMAQFRIFLQVSGHRASLWDYSPLAITWSDAFITWKHFPHNWSFLSGCHDDMETFSTLLALYEGNPPFLVDSLLKGPVILSFECYSVVSMNKLLNKQSCCWWLETWWCPCCCCNEIHHIC